MDLPMTQQGDFSMEKDIEQQFLRDVQNHQMTILRDDGLDLVICVSKSLKTALITLIWLHGTMFW